MSEFRYRYPASAIAGQHRLTVDDILLLRKYMFPTGLTSPDDALQLLALHREDAERCPEWDNWFVEMMTAYIVVHAWPQYSLDDLNADWICAMIAHDGIIQSAAELEFVLHTIEFSRAVPDQISSLALDQLRIALDLNHGAYAAGRGAKRSGISADDIGYIYRILRGSLYEGKLFLSAREIAVFDRIAVLVEGEINHPAWCDLLQSIAIRDEQGHASPVPWLQMQMDDIVLCAAA